MPEQGYDGDSDPLPNVFGDGPFHGADTSGGDGGGNEEWRDCRHGHGDQPDNYPDTGRPGADIYRDTKIKAFGNKSQITDIDIRIFLRDTDPAANKLLDDFEFTPEELRTAMSLVVDKWNESPPTVATYNIENFPYRYNLLIMTSAHLLRMAGYRYMRNSLQYNMSGGSVNDQAKAAEYFAAADKLAAEFNEWMKHKNLELQMEVGWQRL